MRIVPSLYDIVSASFLIALVAWPISYAMPINLTAAPRNHGIVVRLTRGDLSIWFGGTQAFQYPELSFQGTLTTAQMAAGNADYHDWTRGPFVISSVNCLQFLYGLNPAGRAHVVAIPQWLVVALLGIWPARRLIAALRWRSRLRGGHCPRCGYDIRATPDRCPECGTSLSPLRAH
jgi:hypothetical protein